MPTFQELLQSAGSLARGGPPPRPPAPPSALQQMGAQQFQRMQGWSPRPPFPQAPPPAARLEPQQGMPFTPSPQYPQVFGPGGGVSGIPSGGMVAPGISQTLQDLGQQAGIFPGPTQDQYLGMYENLPGVGQNVAGREMMHRARNLLPFGGSQGPGPAMQAESAIRQAEQNRIMGNLGTIPGYYGGMMDHYGGLLRNMFSPQAPSSSPYPPPANPWVAPPLPFAGVPTGGQVNMDQNRMQNMEQRGNRMQNMEQRGNRMQEMGQRGNQPGGMMDVGTTTAGDTVGQAPSPYYAPGPGNLSPDAWKSLQGLGYGPGTPSGPFYGQDPSINPPVTNPYNYPFPDAQILDPFLDPYGPEDLIPQPRPMQPPPEGPMLQPGFPQFVPSPDEYQFPPGPYAGQMRGMFG